MHSAKAPEAIFEADSYSCRGRAGTGHSLRAPARLWWAFDLFSHFRLQYANFAALLCVGALALRAYPIAAVLAVIALVHGWAIKDLWLGGLAAAAPGSEPLRVASANVSNPEPEKVLDSSTPVTPMVLLVEAQGRRWPDVLAAVGADYPHRAPEGWQDGAPVVLFSRHPIVRESVIGSPAGPYLAADLALGERTLTIVGVHPSSPSPKDPSDTRQSNLQLGYLADLLEDTRGPVIVAGDFNTTPWSPFFQDLRNGRTAQCRQRPRRHRNLADLVLAGADPDRPYPGEGSDRRREHRTRFEHGLRSLPRCRRPATHRQVTKRDGPAPAPAFPCPSIGLEDERQQPVHDRQADQEEIPNAKNLKRMVPTPSPSSGNKHRAPR